MQSPRVISINTAKTSLQTEMAQGPLLTSEADEVLLEAMEWVAARRLDLAEEVRKRERNLMLLSNDFMDDPSLSKENLRIQKDEDVITLVIEFRGHITGTRIPSSLVINYFQTLLKK
jgi:hypothetical protein